jgi:DNA modification methylase
MFSFAGDTVLDPFAGTGTTALAALETGRHSLSVEIEPSYIDSIEDRFHKAGSVTARIEINRKPAHAADPAMEANLA